MSRPLMLVRGGSTDAKSFIHARYTSEVQVCTISVYNGVCGHRLTASALDEVEESAVLT
jgi:hypothetical protein